MCVCTSGGLNERIENLFKWEVRQRNLALDESDYTKFLLHPRHSSNQEFIEFNHNSRLLTRPQVLIICMNPGQVKNLMNPTAKQSNAGAGAGLFDIMKGNVETLHPYPPKCHGPHVPFDNGANRPVARIYFILDEDGLNRSNASSVNEHLQFDMSPHLKR